MNDITDLEKLRANTTELEMCVRKGRVDTLLAGRVVVLMAKLIIRLAEVNRIR